MKVSRQHETWKVQLREQGLKSTPLRLTIFDVLKKHSDKPITAEKLHDKILQNSKGDLATVYRNLGLLAEKGLIKKYDFLGKASEFQLGGEHEHTHFFECNVCNEKTEIKDCVVSRIEKDLASQGYRSLSHHLELRGICPACA